MICKEDEMMKRRGKRNVGFGWVVIFFMLNVLYIVKFEMECL